MLFQDFFKDAAGDAHGNVGEYLNEAAVGVEGRPTIVHLPSETFDYFVVDAEVQDGVHHAGHGDSGTGADGEEEGIVHVA